MTGLIAMNDVREFIRAASPWVAMGLLVAILMIRGTASTKNAKDGTAENYGMDGMSLGMCFGLLISVMFGDYTCVGLSIGMLVGMAVGLSVHKE